MFIRTRVKSFVVGVSVFLAVLPISASIPNNVAIQVGPGTALAVLDPAPTQAATYNVAEPGTGQLTSRDPMAVFMERFRVRSHTDDGDAGTPNTGFGTLVSEGAGTPVSVGPLGTGHASALVRISVLKAAKTATVFIAGTPALIVTAGSSASAVVLAPLIAGNMTASASSPTAVHTDLLATFDGSPSTPGSTIALGTPVTRADTTRHLAGDQLSTTPISVGVTGAGGIPTTGVRAIYATATLQTSQAGILSLGGELIPVPKGESIVTTILSPADDGTVKASLTKGTGSLRLDVRGYIPDAGQDASSVNVAGSFVPSADGSPQTLHIRSGSQSPVRLPGVRDRAYTLALVSATPTEKEALLTLGPDDSPRNRGAVIDPVNGAFAQLAIISVEAGETRATLTTGTTTATIISLGDILANTATPGGKAPAVSITSPANNAQVDLFKTGMFTIEGTVAPSPVSIATMTVASSGSVIGSPLVRQSPAGVHWSFQTSIPRSGPVSFSVTATDRAGHRGTSNLTVTASLPPSTATLTAPDAVVLDPKNPADAVTAATSTQVIFAQMPVAKPGQVIVSGPVAAAPLGFLRRITAINKTATGWAADTTPASITEAIHQANIDEFIPLNTLDPAAINSNVPPAPDDTPNVTVNGDGLPVTTIKSGIAVDLAPYPTSGTKQSLTAAPTSGIAARTALASVSTNTAAVDVGYTESLALSAKFGFETGKPKTDFSTANPSTASAAKAAIKANGGVTLEANSQIGMGIHFVLAISPHFGWGRTSVTVDGFSVILSTTSKTSMAGEAYLKVATTDALNKKIATFQLPTTTIPVGPIPVVISSTAEISFESHFSASASYSVTASVQRTQDYGFRYSTAAGMQNASTAPKTTIVPPAFTPNSDAVSISGGLEASIGPTITIASKIWDTAGPFFGMGAQVGAAGTVTYHPGGNTFDYNIFLEGIVQVGIKLTVPIIDSTLFDQVLISLTHRWTLKIWSVPFSGRPTLQITTIALPSGTVGQSYSAVLKAAGGTTPYIWTINGQLPAGLVIDPLTGAITGIPTTPGISTVAATVTDAAISTAALTATVTIQPSSPASASTVQTVSDGGSTYEVRTDGTVWAWGANFAGELGNGTTASSATPAQVLGLSGVKSISTDQYSVFALKTDGTVWAWGSNNVGQLGIGTTANSTVPVKVADLSAVRSITTRVWSTFAVKEDGTVWAWGDNSHGALGNGTIGNSNLPVQVSGLAGVQSITIDFTDANAVFALKSDGTLWAWGWNDRGQLGNGTTLDSPVPVQIAALTGVTKIVAQGGTIEALKSDGTVWAWGSNGNGQLGTGTVLGSSVPVRVTGLADVQTIALGSGGNFVLAVKTDGTVWAWGLNNFGQLGNGTLSSSSVPVQVTGLTGAQIVTTTGSSGFALKTDGTIWSWGNNDVGQLGNGTFSGSSVPVQVTGLTGVQTVTTSGNDRAVFAVRTDGTLWAWGHNDRGQLGDGVIVDLPVPAQIG